MAPASPPGQCPATLFLITSMINTFVFKMVQGASKSLPRTKNTLYIPAETAFDLDLEAENEIDFIK